MGIPFRKSDLDNMVMIAWRLMTLAEENQKNALLFLTYFMGKVVSRKYGVEGWG
jgi:hypothetical protein